MMPTTTATIATSEAPTNTERSYLGRTLPDVRLANGFVRPSCSGAVVGTFVFGRAGAYPRPPPLSVRDHDLTELRGLERVGPEALNGWPP
jgi:hypothetical protein